MHPYIIEALGLIAAFFTTFALLPQGLRAIKTKHTKDLSLPMLAMTAIGTVLWLIYGVIINDFPVIAANAIAIIFASMNLGMKLKYG